jgi:nucleoside-diphosphate-sugar epimerase
MTYQNSAENSLRCLILGCGAVATRTGIILQKQGWQVHAIKRSPESLPSTFATTAMDIHQLDINFFADQPVFDAIIYSVTPDSRDTDDYRNAYVDGVSHILDILKQQHSAVPKFWLHFSSSRVWGEDDGSVVNENTAASASSGAAKSLIEGESLIQQSSLAHCILRFSGIYGKTESSLSKRLHAWADSELNTTAARQKWSNRIHVEDAAGFAAFILQRQFTTGTSYSLYAVTDNEPTQAIELQHWARNILSKTPLKSTSLFEVLTTDTPESNSFQGRHKRIDNTRLSKSGYQLIYPNLSTGYAQITKD